MLNDNLATTKAYFLCLGQAYTQILCVCVCVYIYIYIYICCSSNVSILPNMMKFSLYFTRNYFFVIFKSLLPLELVSELFHTT